jgi:hypothetical protein
MLFALASWFWFWFWVVCIGACMLWGVFGALLAERKGYSRITWYLVCALTGVIGLSVLALRPRQSISDDGVDAGGAPVLKNEGATHEDVTVVARDLWHETDGHRLPPVGQHYVVARVAMTNYGEQTIAYSARRFALEGVDDHRRYDALDVFGRAMQPFCGIIAPGQTVTRDLAFQVPVSDQEWELLWTPDSAAAPIAVPFADQQDSIARFSRQMASVPRSGT